MESRGPRQLRLQWRQQLPDVFVGDRIQFLKKAWSGVFAISFWGAVAGVAAAFGAETKWEAPLPTTARDSAQWARMISELEGQGLLYGAMAAAQHVIALFPDVASKEIAYRAVISTIDAGYPVPVRDIFVPGDLELDPTAGPEAYAFANSYYLYKAMLSRERKSPQWAEYYLRKVDREHFPKYIFLTALDAYGNGDLSEAASLIEKAMALDLAHQPVSAVARMTRTLARIRFEQGDYAKSLEIYRSFLLKMNPVVPTDWLEAAWDEYHLKHYAEALGLIYNLESRSVGRRASLEKYSLRALIYRSTCAVDSLLALANDFDRTFHPVLDGIRRGEPLARFEGLLDLDLPENAEYNRVHQTVTGLQAERARVDRLPSSDAALADYVYRSEILVQSRVLKTLTPEALDRTANQILTTSEQMRFLRFDIERAKYDPDLVFAKAGEIPPAPFAVDDKGDLFQIRWRQPGDYWLDERNEYKAVIQDRCIK